VLLTREGCSNTGIMKSRLAAALRSLQWPADYRVIDLDDLPQSDPMRGYGTPTILYDGRDLFGLPEPTLPDGPPT
jgi:hypothetical protein